MGWSAKPNYKVRFLTGAPKLIMNKFLTRETDRRRATDNINFSYKGAPEYVNIPRKRKYPTYTENYTSSRFLRYRFYRYDRNSKLIQFTGTDHK